MALLDGLGEAFKSLDCGILSASDYILGGIGRFTGLDQGLASNAINGLRRLRGCPEAGDITPPPPPFTGGQCEGTNYRVQGISTVYPRADCEPIVNPFNAFYPGPIRGLRTAVNNPSGPLCTPGQNQVFLSFGPDSNIQEALVAGAGFGASFEITSVTRNSGGLDICGDPPPPILPPINIDVDVPVTFTDEGDNIVNITIPVEFKPFTVNFNGDVSFPFEFSLGGIDFTGDVVFAPDFSLNVNPPRLPKGPINPPPSGSEDEIPVPLKPRGEKIQGVIVVATVNSDQRVSSYEGSPVPDIYVPRLGSVKFAYSFGVSTVWSNDIDVKGTAVFIPCPFSQGADAVQGRPEAGITFSLSAVEGPPIATVADIT